MARPSLLLALLLGGCIAEFPDPPPATPDAGPADATTPVDMAAFDAATEDAPCGFPEICDGLDNDCDQIVDETVPLRPCPLQQGICRGSRELCIGGVYQPCTYADLDQPYTPEEVAPGFCDRVDNDCDGATDEGCTCQAGNIRACGTNEGECSSGNQLCEDGVFGPCTGAREPVIEQLNGVDDDCDGRSDEGPPPEEIILDIADIAVGGLGERPGLPGQVVRGRGLPMPADAPLVLRPAPLVAAVFIPQPGLTRIAEGLTYDFTSHVAGGSDAGLHGKGPAGLLMPELTTERPEYGDPLAHSFLEVPTSYGLTLDLAAITRRFGRPVRRLTTRLGTLGPGRVTFFILVDGVELTRQTLAGSRELGGLEVALPDLGRLLTLVATNAGEPGARPAYLGDPLLHFR